MSYSDLLKDPRWQKKRLEILSRDNFTCTVCGNDKKTLHVHHKSYEGKKFPWEVSNDNLVTFCEVCHTLKEAFKNNKQCKTIGIFRQEYKGTNVYLLNMLYIPANARNIFLYDENLELLCVFDEPAIQEFLKLNPEDNGQD